VDPNDALDYPVILLGDVVDVLALPHLRIGNQVGRHAHDGRPVGAALIDGDLVGDTVQIHGA
jgi:hypothetical protein